MKSIFVAISIINIWSFTSCKTDLKKDEERSNEKEKTELAIDQDYQSEEDSTNGIKNGTEMLISVTASPVVLYKEPEKGADGIWSSAEQMPQFPGGDVELMKFIDENLTCPKGLDACIEGHVILQFVVKVDGSISDIKVLRSLHEDLDKEAVRVVESMPKWIPGKLNGERVDVYYTLPVRFKLEYETDKSKN